MLGSIVLRLVIWLVTRELLGLLGLSHGRTTGSIACSWVGLGVGLGEALLLVACGTCIGRVAVGRVAKGRVVHLRHHVRRHLRSALLSCSRISSKLGVMGSHTWLCAWLRKLLRSLEVAWIKPAVVRVHRRLRPCDTLRMGNIDTLRQTRGHAWVVAVARRQVHAWVGLLELRLLRLLGLLGLLRLLRDCWC